VDGLGLELGEVHRAARLRQLGRRNDLGIVGRVEELRLVHRLFLPAAVVPAVVAVSIAHPAATATMARALVGPVTALIS